MSEGRSWTDRQRLAIDSRGDVLLSAAAGSGKTSVLVARVLSLVCDPGDPIDIDRLLVVTFTEAAAREMRTRIAAELEREIRDRGPDEHQQRQLSLLARAGISTIHAFCLNVVRGRLFELGLEPEMSVLDGLAAELMLADALERAVRTRLERSPGLADLIGRFRAEHPGADLWRDVLRVYDLARSAPDFDRWLEELVAMYSPLAAVADLPWTRDLLGGLAVSLATARDRLERAARLAAREDGPAAYGPVLVAERAMVDDLAAACQSGDWPGFCTRARAVQFQRLPSGSGDESIRDRARKLRDRARKDIGDACALALVDESVLLSDLAGAGQDVAEIVELVRELEREYSRAKHRAGRLDFSDLEILCYRLLQSGTIRDELHRRFDCVLVDEYQDTSPLQDAIIDIVAGDRDNLFLVGDYRQSIYGFRLAEPGLLLGRAEHYQSGRGQVIELSENFRSRIEICDAVNFLFRQLNRDRETTGGDLIPAARYDGPGEPVELVIVERPGSGDEDESWADLVALEREAAVAADRIRGLLAEGTIRGEDGEQRPISMSDIAVLMRATHTRAELVVGVLERAGIRAVAETSSGFFDAPEIVTMLSILQVVDNPRQDIPLAAALRAVTGLTAADLAALRATGRKDDLLSLVRAEADRTGRRAEICRRFLADLDRWRDRAAVSPASDLVWTLLDETGYFNYAGGLPGGLSRRANLQWIHEQCLVFERGGGTGLTGFLSYLDRLGNTGRDPGTASLAAGSDVVKVMSVHKSKGLEFPVVIILDLGRQLEARQSGELAVHRQAGLGTLIVRDDGVAYPGLAMQGIRSVQRRTDRAEELRVLYVALTRARERLFLIGSCPDPDGSWADWVDTGDGPGWYQGDAVVYGGRTYLDLLAPAISRHRTAGAVGSRTPEEVRNHPSRWRVTRERDPVVLERAEPAVAPAVESVSDRYDEVVRRLEWRAPAPVLAGVPGKVGASDLKRRYDPGHEDGSRWERVTGTRDWQMPDLAAEPDVRDRGVAVHRFLQHLDLASTGEAALTVQLTRMVADSVLAPEQAELVNVAEVAAMFRTELGAWLIGMRDRVRREVPFTLGLPASEVFGVDAADPVVVQGVIDCLVVEPDRLTVIDFKLSRGSGEQEARYRDQLGVYVMAAERAFRRPVAGAFVLYVAGGEVLQIDREG